MTQNPKFTDKLRQSAAPIWEADLKHPFVRGMVDGTLATEKFKFYLIQDYLFLLDYSRVFAYGVIKAHDEATMALFAKLLNETLNTEMDLHRGYCAKFGISPAKMEAAPMAPTTHAYTRHMLQVAQIGTLADVIAGVLPCQWGYAEIGTSLAKQGGSPEPLYQEWIDMYASPEFLALGEWLRNLLNDITTDSSPAEKERLQKTFLLSSRYEYLFWEMAWTEQAWQI
ncbi:MAG: thiaminase II [Candidatus Poribacteria bacterium]|nr:thiaminase II [Candidatus Poribacteria bacterium]